MTPLYADLALRTSDVLGDFAENFILPHRYGNLTETAFVLGKLTDTLYVVADHPMQDITAVYETGQKLTAWKWYNGADKTGKTICFVELGQPANATNAIISASGRGKMSSVTGQLIENPADIITDIVGLNGRLLEFPLFKQACARKGLKFAGSLTEIKGLRLYVKQILGSFGALWVADNIIFQNDPSVYTTRVYNYSLPTYVAKLEDRSGNVKVAYRHNEVTNKYGAFLSVGALNSPYKAEKIYYCKWLRDARLALEYATELAKVNAGIFYEVSCTVGAQVHSGQWISLANSFIEGDILITEARLEAAGTSIRGLLVKSRWTNTVLLSYSSEIPERQKEGIELDFANGILTITIYEEDNKPLVGAFVSLDKGTPRKTDTDGKVKFTTTAGGHVLDIAAIGFTSIDNLPIEVQ